MIQRRRIGIALAFAILVLGSVLVAPLARAAWKGQELTVDGVLQVQNPADPVEEPVTHAPVELWRLGGESDADEEIFGRVFTLRADRPEVITPPPQVRFPDGVRTVAWNYGTVLVRGDDPPWASAGTLHIHRHR